jgi:hypothetical protein
MSEKVCTKCKILKPITEYRLKREKKRPEGYYRPECLLCEKKAYKNYQQKNLEYFRESNRQSYLKKVGGKLSRRSPLEMTEEVRKAYHLNKVLLRNTRAKQARVLWDKELTDFVTSESHNLRRLRDVHTKISWHVDHIIPLKGKLVCGLHVWNNLAVIPKVNNLRKGNYYSVHD